MSRVFANGPGDRGSIPGWVIPKTQKMVLDAILFSTLYYKMRINGKLEQSWEWTSTLPLDLIVVAIEKGAFGSPTTKVASLYIGRKTFTNTDTHTLMSCHPHGYPWPFFATSPYRPSLLAGPQGYILYLHRNPKHRFELVALPLLVHVKGSTRVHHFWTRPYFFCRVPHFDSFRDGWWVAV